MRLRLGLDWTGRGSRVPSGHWGAIYEVFFESEARHSVEFGGDYLDWEAIMGFQAPIPLINMVRDD